MNIIEKMILSVKEWIEFYLDNSTLPDRTKDKIRSFVNNLCGDEHG